MKDKKINNAVKTVYEEMFRYWGQHRGPRSGFKQEHEQWLYDAVCAYNTKERKD